MNGFDGAGNTIYSLTKRVIEEEGHHSNPGVELTSNPGEIAGSVCYRAGFGLSSDLKETMEAVKKQDIRATIIGITAVAKKAGVLDACGLEMNNAPLVNAIQAVCPKQWDVVEEQLKVFGEQAWNKLYEWKPAESRL